MVYCFLMKSFTVVQPTPIQISQYSKATHRYKCIFFLPYRTSYIYRSVTSRCCCCFCISRFVLYLWLCPFFECNFVQPFLFIFCYCLSPLLSLSLSLSLSAAVSLRFALPLLEHYLLLCKQSRRRRRIFCFNLLYFFFFISIFFLYFECFFFCFFLLLLRVAVCPAFCFMCMCHIIW